MEMAAVVVVLVVEVVVATNITQDDARSVVSLTTRRDTIQVRLRRNVAVACGMILRFLLVTYMVDGTLFFHYFPLPLRHPISFRKSFCFYSERVSIMYSCVCSPIDQNFSALWFQSIMFLPAYQPLFSEVIAWLSTTKSKHICCFSNQRG